MTFIPKLLSLEIEKQHRYHERLEDLISSNDTINLRYLKVFLVGPPGVGKTTTLDRLLKSMTNLRSIERMPRSTLLANCIQVFAFVSGNGAKWISSSDLNEETVLLFHYLCGCELENVSHKEGEPDIQLENQQQKTQPTSKSFEGKPKEIMDESKGRTKETVKSMESKLEHKESKETIQHDRIMNFIGRLQKLVDGSFLPNLSGSTLLTINDIGGQPGFLEMLPALSTGPTMYLVFLDLSKELDKPYKIPFSRDDMIITPYDAVHTVKSTISQIL